MENPGIFFFPLSEPTPVQVTGLESGVLARRIPDFLCICLNDAGRDNASLLEMRAADENGVPTGDWASFKELPPADDILSFLPEEGVMAAVVGTLKQAHRLDRTITRSDGLDLEIDVTVIRESEGLPAKSFPWYLNLEDPGSSCMELARRIAKEFAMPLSPRNWQRFGTKSSSAFLNFLRGLDGAACLDPDVMGMREPKELLMPFVEALELDPDFGLALRRLHVAINEAINTYAMPLEDGVSLLDQAYATYPSDREAAASIGEYMAALDELDRAEDWLRLAVDQEEPPPSALETLGILLANRGETVQARNLWLTGVRVDGHPDFFAHLARLAFSEDQFDEAWDKVTRGLRRISERSLHPGEWEDEEGRGGVLLRYLSEHLEEVDSKPPRDVVELIGDLAKQIREPEDRLDLGLCLLHVGLDEKAEQALRAALPHVENSDRRDLGSQYLAEMMFADFDENFDHAANVEARGDDLIAAQNFLTAVLSEVPQFWPARYFRGKLFELELDWEQAFEDYRQAASLRRDQPPILLKLANAAEKLGRRDEACDALESAVELDPSSPQLHADYALVLYRSGRLEDAVNQLEIAETLDPEHDAIRRAREVIDGEVDEPLSD